MKVQIINKSNNQLPKYETPRSAGMDIRADFSRVSPQNNLRAYGDCEIIYKGDYHNTTMLRLDPGARALIPTGIFTSIPEGYEVQLRPRSGLAIKKGLNLINCVGTIDSDYTSEWGIPVVNQGLEAIWIEDGERICQAVLNKVEQIEWEEVDKIEKTDRTGGFGSTGTK
jgi:dUTP pyrophosphatase